MTRRRIAGVAAILAALCLGAFAGSSSAAFIGGWVWVGNVKFTLGAEYNPDRAPAGRFVPIELSTWMRITTGDRAFPPRLDQILVDLDENVRLVHEGLGTCDRAAIEFAPSKRARKRCRSALIGSGTVKATVRLEGRPRFDVKGPLSIFNGLDEQGRPAVVLHAAASIGTPFLVDVAIDDSPQEGFGQRLTVRIPEIAGGQGVLTGLRVNLDKRPRGKRFLLAKCSGRQVNVDVAFDLHPEQPAYPDGRDFDVSWLAPCRTIGPGR